MPKGELTARDLLMRTRRLFTSGQWTRFALHKTRVTEDDQWVDLYCTLGGLRHSAGLMVAHSPGEDNGAYWEAINLIADPDKDPWLMTLVKSGRTRSLRAEQEACVARKNDGTDVEGVIKMIDEAVEKVTA